MSDLTNAIDKWLAAGADSQPDADAVDATMHRMLLSGDSNRIRATSDDTIRLSVMFEGVTMDEVRAKMRAYLRKLLGE